MSKLNYTVGLLALVSAAVSQAEEAVVGQYIISSWRPNKVVERSIEEATGDTFGVVGEVPHGKLLQVGDGDAIQAKDDRFYDDITNYACEDLRDYTRERARIKARTDSNEVVRRFECAPNFKVTAAANLNDQYWNQQWAGNNAPYGANLREAYDLTSGNSNVIVGVIDTGIQLNHPDLAENIWVNPGEIAGNGIDDDGNGYVDDVNGWNFINESNNPNDDQGHGTHCAGTIGARGNNGIGVAGVTSYVKMIALKFLNNQGSGNTWDALQAINYVNDMVQNRNVKVMLTSNSWGGGGYIGAMQTAITLAETLGIMVVAAAGNNARDIDQLAYYPAKYTGSNMVVVAATDSSGSRALRFSNWGANSVHMGAPGDNIVSTYLNGGYAALSGTSMATPHVAGALALARAYNQSASWQTLRSALLSTGYAIPGLIGFTVTGKTLNVRALLDAVGPGSAPPPSSPTPTPVPTVSPTATPLPPTPPPTPQPTATPTPTPEVMGAVSVRVTDATGAAIPGANVTYFAERRDGMQYSKSQLTNELSRANMNGVWVGGLKLFRVSAELAGYQFSAVTGSNIANNSIITIFGAKISHEVSAEVLDQNGRPVPGVQISCAECIGNKSGTTDAQGEVNFTAAHGTSITLIATRPSGMRGLYNYLNWVVFGAAKRRFVLIGPN